MPVILNIGDKERWISPTTEWKTEKIPSSKMPVTLKRDFYVNVKML